MTKTPDPDDVLRVSQYFAAAYTASVLGQGMDYTRKKYAHVPVGDFWLEIAKLVIGAFDRANESNDQHTCHYRARCALHVRTRHLAGG